MHLSPEQVAHYRRVGYIKMSEAIPSDFLARLSIAFDRLFSVAAGPLWRTDSEQVAKIYDLYARGDPFTELIASSHIVEPLTDLLGANILFNRFRHNHATLNPPGLNVFRLHRDTLQWSRPIVAVIVYIDESIQRNGCTHVIPGSHHWPYRGNPAGTAGMRITEDPLYQQFAGQEVPVELPAGGALLFDGGLFHSVGINRDGGNRRSIALSYHSVDETDFNSNPHGKVLVSGRMVYRGWDSPEVDGLLAQPTVK